MIHVPITTKEKLKKNKQHINRGQIKFLNETSLISHNKPTVPPGVKGKKNKCSDKARSNITCLDPLPVLPSI